jgi:DNA mismatch repair protein MutS
MCQICHYIPVKENDKELETHHINFQKDADYLNFNKHFHKNTKHNLVSLCRKCHTKVHNGELINESLFIK